MRISRGRECGEGVITMMTTKSDLSVGAHEGRKVRIVRDRSNELDKANQSPISVDLYCYRRSISLRRGFISFSVHFNLTQTSTPLAT